MEPSRRESQQAVDGTLRRKRVNNPVEERNLWGENNPQQSTNRRPESNHDEAAAQMDRISQRTASLLVPGQFAKLWKNVPWPTPNPETIAICAAVLLGCEI